MRDVGNERTEKELQKLERKIASVYSDASKDLQKTITEYFKKLEKRDAEQRELLEQGKITEEHYKQWRLAQMGRGKRFEALMDKLAKRSTDAKEVAYAYMNDKTPGIYSLNRNYTAYEIDNISGGEYSASVDFILYNEQVVRRLIVEHPGLMPNYPKERALKRGIDLDYGRDQITKSITSSILMGAGIGKIADDLQDRLANMSRASAIRTARTAFTEAQNAGRQDAYEAAAAMGIEVKKRWIATKDFRTRHAHGVADGQTVPIDQPFKVDGWDMKYPCDPSAPGYLVYNCRCTTRTVEKDGIEAEPRKIRVMDPKTGELVVVNEMTYTKWEQWAKGRSNDTYNTVTGGYIPVTAKSLTSIKPFKSSVIPDAAQSRFVNYSKKLLMEVRKYPEGTEIGRCFSLNMEPKCGHVVGEQGRVHLPDFNEPYMSIHNHPDGSTLSPGDLRQLTHHDNLKFIMAIGHDGAMFAIEKAEDYDKIGLTQHIITMNRTLRRYARNNKNLHGLNNIADYYLREAEHYGVKYYRREN